jgi:pilus assembly protein CpaB
MNNRSILIFSLVFGILTFLITTFYLSNVAKEQKVKNELIAVVVAKVNIPVKTVLIKENLEIVKLPRQYVLAGAHANLEEIIGKVAAVPFMIGEQIIDRKISLRNRQMGLAVIIPKNKRAVSVEVDASASIAGLIKPGDMVDIVCTLQELNRTVTILQNIQVLAIDQALENDNKNTGKINRSVIATMALDIKDSERLILASSKGVLKLLLRPVDDDTTVFSSGATVPQLLPYVPNSCYARPAGYKITVYKGTKVENKSM